MNKDKVSTNGFFIGVVVATVAAALMIPLDFFIVNVPRWICAVLILAAVLADVFYCLGKSKLWKKITLSVAGAFFWLAVIFFAFFWPYWNSVVYKIKGAPVSPAYNSELSQKQALEDLDYAYKQLERIHPAMRIKKGSEYKTVTAAYEKQRAVISGVQSLTINELARCVQRVFSTLQDAHTGSIPQYANPLYYRELKNINDSEYGFHGINGVPYKDLLQQKKDLFSYEKEAWAIKDLADYCIRIDLLDFLELDPANGVTYMLKNDDGDIIERKANPEEFVTAEEYYKYNNIDRNAQSPAKPFVYYEIDEEHSLAVLTLTSCNNNKVYKECLYKMFTEVKECGLKNVAVDLRGNGGGNSLVINSFFRYLDIDSFYESSWDVRYGPFVAKHTRPLSKNNRIKDLLFYGNVFVLTNERSFSSAMMFPQYVKDNGLGKIIGETPANDPSGYGDTVRNYLPNSHIKIFISKTDFTRVDPTCPDKYVEPDYPCKSSEVMEELYRHCAY